MNPPRSVLDAVLSRVLEADQALDRERLIGLIRALTRGQRLVFSVRYLEMEVNSGGFDCFFSYQGGDYAQDALEGLQLVGAVQFAKVLRNTMALFPHPGPSPDIDIRFDQVVAINEKYPDALGNLDCKFYDAYEGEESLTKKLIQFIKENPHEFFID